MQTSLVAKVLESKLTMHVVHYLIINLRCMMLVFHIHLISERGSESINKVHL